MSQKIISIFTSTEGHWSISQAVGETLEQAGYKVHLNKHEGFEFAFYRQIYKHRPELFKYFYRLGKHRLALYMTKKYSQYNYEKIVSQQIKEQKPNAIISSWFFLNPILGKSAEDLKIPFINVVANPRTIHPLEISPLAENLVFDKKAKTNAKNLPIEAESIIDIGWFVKDDFEKVYDRTLVRELLHIHPDKKVLLFQGGSEGSKTTYDLFEKFANHVPENTYIILITGRNKRMFNKASKYSSSKVEVLGYTNHMATYMQAADLVIGKAGPNSIFEAIATKTPFFATTHITGQEDGNLDIISDYKVGFVQEDATKAKVLLNNLLLDNSLISKLTKNLLDLEQLNRNSKKELVQLVDDLINR